jgi:hypothetical protein
MARLSGMSVDIWEEVRAAVRRGAALLDEKAAQGLVPADWRKVIDPDWLNLASCRDCVLGQLAQQGKTAVDCFHGMVNVLGVGFEGSSAYGFTVNEDIRADFGVLTLAWRQYLEECQAV